jgi:hypothetical protein
MFRFKSLCGLPIIHGTLDGTHFVVAKHVGIFNEDYYYHNNEVYATICKVIVNHMKLFIGLFVAFFGFTNNSQVLCKFLFYVQT